MAVLEINTPAQQQALRRARWQVAVLSFGFIAALSAAISGWWMYWQNTVAQHQQGRTLQACRDLVKQREEIIAHTRDVIGTAAVELETSQDNLTDGSNAIQALLKLARATYLPERERGLETEIQALRAKFQSIEAQMQRDALAQRQSKTASIRPKQNNTSDRLTNELLNLMQDFWQTGAAFAKTESQKQLYELRKNSLKPLEQKLRQQAAAQAPLDQISLVLYNFLKDLEMMPDWPDDARASRNSTHVTSINSVSSDFKEGYVPVKFSTSAYDFKNKAQALQEHAQKSLAALYSSGYSAGQKAEKDALTSELHVKTQELAAVQTSIKALEQKVAASANEQQRALTSLNTQRETASQTYALAAQTFQNAGAVLQAERAFQQNDYETAIRHALRALRSDFDLVVVYRPLILSLEQLRIQDLLTRAFLDEIFPMANTLFDAWLSDGTLQKFDREIKRYLVRCYYEFALFYKHLSEFDRALSAIDRAMLVAETIPGDEKNKKSLQAFRQEIGASKTIRPTR